MRAPRPLRMKCQTRSSQIKDLLLENLEKAVAKLKEKVRRTRKIVDAATVGKRYNRLKLWEDWWASLPQSRKALVPSPPPKMFNALGRRVHGFPIRARL